MTGVDLNQLRYFQAIARCGSLSKAARELSVSQPTLTVSIRQLEERLKTTLLLRDRSGVSLSSTGEALLRGAEEMLRVLAHTEQRILGLETEETGGFVVGCHESLGAYYLPRMLQGFMKEAPQIEVTLWNGTSAGVREAVLARAVDFGLAVNPAPHPDLVLVTLFKDAVEILVAPELLDGLGPAPSLATAQALITRGPLIYAGRVAQCQELVGRLAMLGVLPLRVLTCGDLELVKSLALAALGVALLPRRVADYGQTGRLQRLHAELPFIPDTIYLLYRGDLHRTRAALRLKDALIRSGKGLDAPV